jgi:hypothetical protein
VKSVTAADVGELRTMLPELPPDTTILFASGHYDLSGGSLDITVPGTILRAAEEDPGAVVLDGGGHANALLRVLAPQVIIANLTLTASEVAIDVPAAKATADGLIVYRVHARDNLRGLLAGQLAPSAQTADRALVACSRFEITDSGRAQLGCSSAITGRRVRDWRLLGNTFRGHFGEGCTVSTVAFYAGSRDTVIRGNRFIDNVLNLLVGFSEGIGAPYRIYGDSPCDGAAHQHVGGVICNNFVYGSSIIGGAFDTGIGVWDACGVLVAHNTVISTVPPYSSLEYRYATTTAQFVNNIASHNLRDRNGTATLDSNLVGTNEVGDFFVAAGEADLHLRPDASAAIDQGSVAALQRCPNDIDSQGRDSQPDIGADELLSR